MGWKRIKHDSRDILPSLSENQCGMETLEGTLCGVKERLVEREPMWDGN